jgi:EAL domain-containing protein (putative c-di-GMP-specific phosphodiesterase class I)
VIAEDVETQAQLRIIASFDCDYVQGYYISGSVGGAEFEELLGEKYKIGLL